MQTLTELVQEASRQLSVCNSCRYCEGYCAVFPALERRQALDPGDVSHLANLCHDCRGCLQACMYTPPHELAVNIPAILTDVRAADYRRYAWPGPMAAAFDSVWGFATLAAAVGVIAALLGVWSSGGFAHFLDAFGRPGSFYRIVRYELMVVPGLILSAWIGLVFAVGFARFWASTAPRGSRPALRDLALAAWDALTLRWQDGGGPGCYFPDESKPSRARRYLHITLVVGFLAAFASTLVAAAYQDFLGLLPPYALLSLPVVLGSAGGVGLIVGSSGLLYLKLRGGVRADVRALDLAFLIVIDLAAVTGMLTLVVRDTRAMGPALTLHLAVLFGLYLTVPYGKLIHAVYRSGAVVRDRLERRAEASSA